MLVFLRKGQTRGRKLPRILPNVKILMGTSSAPEGRIYCCVTALSIWGTIKHRSFIPLIEEMKIYATRALRNPQAGIIKMLAGYSRFWAQLRSECSIREWYEHGARHNLWKSSWWLLMKLIERIWIAKCRSMCKAVIKAKLVRGCPSDIKFEDKEWGSKSNWLPNTSYSVIGPVRKK